MCDIFKNIIIICDIYSQKLTVPSAQSVFLKDFNKDISDNGYSEKMQENRWM